VNGRPSRPARAGEIMTLYGTGFGPASPAFPAGKVVAGAAPLANLVTVSIGGRNAEVLYAGQVGSGLNQFNLRVPAESYGANEILTSVAGQQVRSYLAVERNGGKCVSNTAPLVEVDSLTRAVQLCPVQYPPLARQARVQGTVRMRVSIDEHGRVCNLELVSGHPLLVPEAQKVLSFTRYNPHPLGSVRFVDDTVFTLP
jgi:TonB family protein